MREKTTWRCPIEVGRLIRGDVRRQLRQWAFVANLEIQIEEDKGWLKSLLLVTVKGEPEDVIRFAKRVERYLRHIDSSWEGRTDEA